MAEEEKLIIYFDPKGLERLEKSIGGNKNFQKSIDNLNRSIRTLIKRIEQISNITKNPSIGRSATYINASSTIIPVVTGGSRRSEGKVPPPVPPDVIRPGFFEKIFSFIHQKLRMVVKSFLDRIQPGFFEKSFGSIHQKIRSVFGSILDKIHVKTSDIANRLLYSYRSFLIKRMRYYGRKYAEESPVVRDKISEYSRKTGIPTDVLYDNPKLLPWRLRRDLKRVDKYWEKGWKSANSFSEAVKTKVDEKINKIRGKLSNVGTKIEEFVKNIGNFFDKIIGKSLETVSKILDKSVTPIRNLGRSLDRIFSKSFRSFSRSLKSGIIYLGNAFRRIGRFFLRNITQLSSMIAGQYWALNKIYSRGIKELTDLRNILSYAKLTNVKLSKRELEEFINELELTNINREKSLRYIQALMTAGIPKNRWKSFIFTTHAIGKLMGREPDMLFNQMLRFLQGGAFPSMYLNTLGITKEKFMQQLGEAANLQGIRVNLKDILKNGIPESLRTTALDILLKDIHKKIPEKYFTELGSTDVWGNIHTRLKQSIFIPFSEGFVYGIQSKLEKLFKDINDKYSENAAKYKYFGEIIGRMVGEILINVKKGADALAKISEYLGTKYAEANMNIEDYFTKHPLAREAVNFAQGGLELSILNYLKYSDTNLFPITSYIEKKWD